MPLYELAHRRYFRENGKTYHAGQTVELSEEVANEILRNEGPVLKPARQTTQAEPTVVRSKPGRRKK